MLGRRTRTIVIGALLMALGHFLMTFEASLLLELACRMLGWQVPVTWLQAVDAVMSAATMVASIAFWRWWATRRREPDDLSKMARGSLVTEAAPALLVLMAARVTQAVRANHRVARMGSDDFAVLTICSGREHVDPICRRSVTALGEPMPFNGAAVPMSASIGTAAQPVHGSSPDVLYKAADVALYEAKRDGCGIWRCDGEIAVPPAIAAVPAEDLTGI